MTTRQMSNRFLSAVSCMGTGQTLMVLPTVPRQPHPTGVQVPCAACSTAGVDRLGLPRFPGDPTAYCMPCWLAEERRRQRAGDDKLLATYADVAHLPVDGQPAVDGPVDQAGAEQLLGDEPCGVCGSSEPGPDCWLCSWAWLADARRSFELEMDLGRAAVNARFEDLATITAAEDYLADLVGIEERLVACAEEYRRPRPGSRGRPVELLADLLVREGSVRTTPAGRPGTLPLVAAVMALLSDWRSGRRSMPGRARLAGLLGVSERTVTAVWRKLEALKWIGLVRPGRKLTLVERCRLGRTADRAEWDIVQLHASTVPVEARDAAVPAALDVLDRLLAIVRARRAEAEHDLAVLQAAQRTLWSPGLPDQIAAAQRHEKASTIVKEACDQPASIDTCNFFTPRMAYRGPYVSSGPSLGLRYSRRIMIHSDCGRASASGRGTEGASRASTRGRAVGSDTESSRCGDKCNRPQHVEHPRMPGGKRRRSPRWESWAHDLARESVERLPWLARSPRPWVVAVLGATLGPDWTADMVVDLVQAYGSPGDGATIHAPAAYLRAILGYAMAYGRAQLNARDVASATTAVYGHAQLIAELDARDAAAATGTARSAGVTAARAAIRRRPVGPPEVTPR